MKRRGKRAIPVFCSQKAQPRPSHPSLAQPSPALRFQQEFASHRSHRSRPLPGQHLSQKSFGVFGEPHPGSSGAGKGLRELGLALPARFPAEPAGQWRIVRWGEENDLMVFVQGKVSLGTPASPGEAAPAEPRRERCPKRFSRSFSMGRTRARPPRPGGDGTSATGWFGDTGTQPGDSEPAPKP